MQKLQMVNTGLIGLGYWGKILKPKIESSSTLKFASSGRNPVEYEQELSKVDWVFVATPNETHYEVVQRCLQRGVNVFCEKPLTSSRKKSEELFKLADSLGLTLYVDDVFWFRDESRDLDEAIKAKKPQTIRFETRKYGSFKSSLFNNATYHDLCVLYYLIGRLDFKDLHFDQNEEDTKEFHFTLDGVRIEIAHDRKFSGKEKKTFLDGRLFDYSSPRNDALGDLVKKVLSGEVDPQKNRAMCLEVESALERLSRS